MEIGDFRGIKGDGYYLKKRIDPEGHRVTSNSRADQRGLIKNYVVKRVSSLKMFPKVMLRVSLLAYISKYSPSFKTSISYFDIYLSGPARHNHTVVVAASVVVVEFY